MATITIASQPHFDDSIIAIDRAASLYPWSHSAWLSSVGPHYHLYAAYRAEPAQVVGVQPIEPIGFYLAHIVSDQCTLMNIAVHPKAQRAGVGRQLVKHLLELARMQQCQQVWLEVRASNRAAQALYESLDFSLVTVRKDYYAHTHQPAENGLVMCHQFTAP